MIKQYEVFTDGSCPKPQFEGGYAAILREIGGEETIISGNAKNTTNNRMELLGVITPLRQIPVGSEVTICSDSEYVLKGISEWMPNWKRRGWKTADNKPVKNEDLWKELDKLISGLKIKTNWVRGHNGHQENERCDVLAGLETKKAQSQS